ncbi:MAG: CAP domain-containing protein [Planctomycetes bacterium]|nr:CAP domain-containing protein [Planctomycetota bacterium]
MSAPRNRLLILCAVLTVLAASALRAEVAPADVQAALNLLADKDPVTAGSACRGLKKSAKAGTLDDDACVKVVEAANRRLEEADRIVQAGLADPRLRAAVAARKKELDAARSKALALLESETNYPEGPVGSAPQQAADAAVAEVERLAETRAADALGAVPDLPAHLALAGDLAELLAWAGSPRIGRRATFYQLESAVAKVLDPEGEAAWETLAFNAFGPGPDGIEAPAERFVLAQVNEYRLALGLEPLRFDARLYRAAAWFAKESFAKKLNGHFCDVAGRADPTQRAEAEGHRKCNGECVAYNGTHFEDWRKSASHHRVLVERRQSKAAAVAIFGNVAVLVTGLDDPPRGSRPSSVPAAQAALWAELARASRGRPRGEAAERLCAVARHLAARKALPQAQEAYAAALAFDAQCAGVPLELRKAAAAKVTAPAPELFQDADPAKRRAAWIAEARVDPAAARERAQAELKGEAREARADAAAALEALGGNESVGALLEVFDRDLSDYAVIRAVEFLLARGSAMHFGDTREQREAKVKALRDAWAARPAE